VIPLKHHLPKVPLIAIDKYLFKEPTAEFFDIMLIIEPDGAGNIVLYRPHAEPDAEYEELDMWYGAILDYVEDRDIKKAMLTNLINDTRLEITIHEKQLLGLTEEERDKRWIRRNLTPYYSVSVISRSEWLRRHIDEEKKDLMKYEKVLFYLLLGGSEKENT